jgi:hypothetical protein
MSRFTLHRCEWCHCLRQEQEMLEFRGKRFCGLTHQLAYERKNHAKKSAGSHLAPVDDPTIDV